MRGCVMVVRLFKGERRSARSGGLALFRYVATLTVVIGAAATGGAAFWDAMMMPPGHVGSTAAVTAAGTAADANTASAVLESNDWTQALRTEAYWPRKAPSAGRAVVVAKPDVEQRSQTPRSGLIKASVPSPAPSRSKPLASKDERADAADWYTGDGGNHRTVCVRLCDGYFWPISFSTDSDHFDRDKRVCEKSCGAPTRLFVHENPGQDVGQMVDLKGVPYTKLRTAFLFRTSYEENCRCNAQPWEQASIDRHRIYALEAEKRKGSQHAAAELTRMKSALLEARKAASTVRTAMIESGRAALVTGSVAGMKRVDAPVPMVIAGHAPMSASLQSTATALPVAAELAGREPMAAAAATKPDRLPQWAQMLPQTAPSTGLSPVVSDQSNVPSVSAPGALRLASTERGLTLPAAPFALARSAPVVTPSKPPAAAKPKLAQANGLLVAAPPIIAGANDELGIKAPLAVNTAQLEQIYPTANAKPAAPVDERVAALEPPEPKPRRVEPRRDPPVVERREIEPPRAEPRPRPRPEPRSEPRPEPRQERRVVAPPARVVERPAPRPAVRVVEAPRPQPVVRARPQQVTVIRNDSWRARVFEPR